MVFDSLSGIVLTCDGRDCGKLVSLSLVREINRIPFLRVSLSWNGEDDPGKFPPGSVLELKAAGKPEIALFKGVLTGTCVLLRDGERTLRLEARDKAHAMTLERRFELYLDQSDADIYAGLCSARGLKADIPGTSFKHRQLQQAGATDWDFLLSRLWANGLAAMVNDGTVAAQSVNRLGEGRVLELDGVSDPVTEAEVRTENRAWFAKVTARAWDEAERKEIRASASSARPPFPGSAAGAGQAEQDVFIPHAVDKAELENLAQGLLWRSRQGFVCGRVRLRGFCRAVPGDGLKLKGICGAADGRSVIWATRLELRAGECCQDIQFGTDFLERMREKGGGGLASPLEGELSRLGGLFPARVLRLSEDPDKGGRIRVHIPLLHAEGQGVWARYCTLYAGKSRGVVFRPEPGDEVLVGFLGADPRAPVVLGGLASAAAPAPDALAAKDEKNSCKGFVSRNGLKILWDEEKKSVRLETPGGRSLCLDDDRKEISMQDGQGNGLILNDKGLTLKTDKDVAVQALGGIVLKGAKSFKAEGLQVSVEGKQSLTLSGTAAAELKASGVLTVKGGLVKIN